MTNFVIYRGRRVAPVILSESCPDCGQPTRFDDGQNLVCESCDIMLNKYGHWVSRELVVYHLEHLDGGYSHASAH